MDTANFYHRGGVLLEQLAPKLSRVAEHRRGENDYITGDLENLNVILTNQSASIKGSLAKWFNGNNVEPLTRYDTQRSIEKLSDLLHLPMKDAKVTRLDFASTLSMSEKPALYFPYLGSSQHFKRETYGTTLYFKNGKREKYFYDKFLECKAKQTPLLGLENENLLRFELRYLKQLDKVFNVSEVKGSMLYKEDFYIGLVERWVTEYKNITKNKLFIPSMKNLTNKNANDVLLAFLIENHGQNEVLKLAENWRGHFSNDREFYRFKAKLKNMKALTKPSPLITELDTKILQEKKHFFEKCL